MGLRGDKIYARPEPGQKSGGPVGGAVTYVTAGTLQEELSLQQNPLAVPVPALDMSLSL